MTTAAIVGAGPGLGQATARSFGRECFTRALISRTQENVDWLAAAWAAEGITARGYAADVQDRVAPAGALNQAGAEPGPVEVLQYSPVPREDFLRGVLQTTLEEPAERLWMIHRQPGDFRTTAAGEAA